MEDATISMDIILGHYEISSWLEWQPDGSAVGMGRIREYDGDGRLVRDVTEPTGARLMWR